jgi:hypothetical protein
MAAAQGRRPGKNQTDRDPGQQDRQGAAGAGAVEEGGAPQQAAARARREQLADGPARFRQELGGRRDPGERVPDQHHEQRPEGGPGPADRLASPHPAATA